MADNSLHGKPLVIMTTHGAFATTEYTKEDLQETIKSGDPLYFTAEKTCCITEFVQNIPSPDGMEPKQRIHRAYMSIAAAEEAEEIVVPAGQVMAWYHTYRLPPQEAFDDTIKSGQDALLRLRSNIVLARPGGLPEGKIIQLGGDE